MLDAIQGTVLAIEDNVITVQTPSISFAIQVPTPQRYQLNMPAHIITHLHWNQELGPTLFGFSSLAERKVFLIIIECAGIGPKLALSILDQLGIARLTQAIQMGDEKALSSISGIGTKKAEQLMIHLKHKLLKLIERGDIVLEGQEQLHWTELNAVLKSLNYSRDEIKQALNYLAAQPITKEASFDQLVRHALAFLAKRVSM